MTNLTSFALGLSYINCYDNIGLDSITSNSGSGQWYYMTVVKPYCERNLHNKWMNKLSDAPREIFSTNEGRD